MLFFDIFRSSECMECIVNLTSLIVFFISLKFCFAFKSILYMNVLSIYCYSFIYHCSVQFRFLLPATLIVINDIFAYIFGFFFGRTPLIKLSPKKTWEGFIGASVTTIISAFVVSTVFT